LAWRKGSFIFHLPLASHHSITSSARPSSIGGTSRGIRGTGFMECRTGHLGISTPWRRRILSPWPISRYMRR
jgi:hypothetical protein